MARSVRIVCDRCAEDMAAINFDLMIRRYEPAAERMHRIDLCSKCFHWLLDQCRVTYESLQPKKQGRDGAVVED